MLHRLRPSFLPISCPSLPISCPSRQRCGNGCGQGIDAPAGEWFIRAQGLCRHRSEHGKRRWLTRTVHGDRADAFRELKAFAARANVAPAVGARTTMGELLDLWFARCCTG